MCGDCSKGREYVPGHYQKVRVCGACQSEIRTRRLEARRQGKATLHLFRINEEF